MKTVSTAYEDSGRTLQKQRTRAALVAAARDLLARDGSAPTVEQAAAAASISRTTAYRYFPSQRSLLVAAHPETGTTSLLPADAGDDPEKRLLGAVRAFHELIVETEPQHDPLLGLGVHDQLVKGPDRAEESLLRVVAGVGGQERRRTCLGMGRDQERPLAREVAVGRRPRDGGRRGSLLDGRC